MQISNLNKIKYYIIDFIKFAIKSLNLETNSVPKFKINFDVNFAYNNKTFASYYYEDNYIVISVINRNLADVLRSLGHEITHQKQNTIETISDESGITGSKVENVANAVTGILLREYGRKNPEIYKIFIK